LLPGMGGFIKSKRHTRGLRFVATDVGHAVGDGPEVRSGRTADPGDERTTGRARRARRRGSGDPARTHRVASPPLNALSFFGLERTDDPLRWRLPVVRGLCSGFGALFGGVGLGASVEVLEQVTGRPLVWATAQFLQYAYPPAVVELDVDEVVRGRSSSQARVLDRVDGTEIFTVVAALGQRTLPW